MTAFNPFARTSTTPYNKAKPIDKSFNPKTMDQLVTITKIDTDAKLIYGVNSSGKQSVYAIDASVLKRTVKRVGSQAGYSGAFIDSDMAKVFAVGHKVVAERSKYVEGSKVISMDGVDYTQYTANWIHNVSQGEGKTFPALITASNSKNSQSRICNVQLWKTMAIDAFDNKKVQEAADLFEDRFLAKKLNKNLPSMGYQLRALREGVTFGRPGLICFDSSSPQDFISIKNNDVWTYHGISGSTLKQTISQYMEYLGETYPDESYKLELMVYQSYFASTYSKSLDVGDFIKAPKSKMISRVGRKSVTDEKGYVGKNVAVQGIVVFVEDKDVVDKVAKTFDTEKRDFVNSIHVNNTLYDIRSAVRSPTTLTVIVSDEIKVIIIDAKPEDNPVIAAIKTFTPNPEYVKAPGNKSSVKIGEAFTEEMDDIFGDLPFENDKKS